MTFIVNNINRILGLALIAALALYPSQILEFIMRLSAGAYNIVAGALQ